MLWENVYIETRLVILNFCLKNRHYEINSDKTGFPEQGHHVRPSLWEAMRGREREKKMEKKGKKIM